MRTETDAILSLQRYVAAALPDFVEVLTELEQEVPPRPYAVVSADGTRAVTGRRDAPVNVLPCTVSAYVVGSTHAAARQAVEDTHEMLADAFLRGLGDTPANLVPLFDYAGTPAVLHLAPLAGSWTLTRGSESATLGADAQPGEVADALAAFGGLDGGRILVWGKAGGPFEVRFDGALRGEPVGTFTIAGGTVTVLAVGDPAPWRTARDFLRIDAVQLGTLEDPADRRLRTVTCGLRVAWGAAREVPPASVFSGITAHAGPAST